MSRTVKLRLANIRPGGLGAVVAELRADVAAALRTVDARSAPSVRVTADCSYVGQSSVLPVPVPDPDSADGTSIGRDFARMYHRTYGHNHSDVAVEVVTVTVAGQLEIARRQPPRDTRPPATVATTRRAWSHVTDRFEDFAVRWRTTLLPGDVLDGPVIIAETESTTVVDVDGRAIVDDAGNLLVEVGS